MVLLKFLSRLPLSILYLISDFLSFMTYHIVRYRRKVVYDNVRKSFPEKTEKEVQKIVRDFYTNLSDTVVEIIKAITIDKEDLKQRIVIKNPELISAEKEKGQSILILASHQCNWEWILLGAGAQLEMPIDAVYQRLSEEFSEKLMYGIRSRFGGLPIERDSLIKEIMKRRRETRVIAMVADQTPHRSNKKYWTTFLGRDTAFYQGADLITQMTKYPAFFAGIKRVKRGFYEVEFVQVGQPPYEKGSFDVVENYAKACEKVIVEAPSDWLWSHKRWKYDKPVYEE